ncbi:MAG TPA: hypothetical protein VFB20_10770, partial [Burkholderiales bacterium]|nr:hypothetical protein [Burkholderiales bacterium]
HCKMVALIRLVFDGPRPPARERYWRIRRTARTPQRDYSYTTQTVDGKYWAIERKWVKDGARKQAIIVRKVGFAVRRKARERAYSWYTKGLEA